MKKMICGLAILSICILSSACGQGTGEKVDEIISEAQTSGSGQMGGVYIVPLENVVGIFQNDDNDEVQLILKEPEQMYINGTVIAENGNMGELSDFIVVYQDDNMLVYDDDETDYVLTVNLLDDNTIEIVEANPSSIHGNGITFDGVWTK